MLNVMDFGAIGDGVADDWAAIQSAFDAAKPDFATLSSWNGSALKDRTPPVYFPAGVYRIGGKINAWSKVPIIGEGHGTIILLDASAPDDVIFEMSASKAGVQNYYTMSQIRGLSIDSEKPGVTGFRPAPSISIMIHGIMEDVSFFRVKRGVDTFPAYAQKMTFERLLAHSGVAQIMRLTGNENRVSNIERDAGGTVDSDLPWFHLTPHVSSATPGMNEVSDVLIQQVMSGSQTCMRFEKCVGLLTGGGWEETVDEAYVMEFIECRGVDVLPFNANTPKPNKYLVDRSFVRFLWLGAMGTPAQGVNSWRDMIEVRGESSVAVETMDTWMDATIPQADATTFVSRFARRSRMQTASAGNVMTTMIAHSHPAGQLVVNGNFAAGLAGWNMLGNIAAAVADGKVLLSGTGGRFRQRLTITPDKVGVPLTVAVSGKVTGAGNVSCLASGCGIAVNSNTSPIPKDGQVHTTIMTVKPQVAGVLDVGAELGGGQPADVLEIHGISVMWGAYHAPVSPVTGGHQFMASQSGGMLAAGPIDMAGVGSPEGVVSAPSGSTWRRFDGGIGSSFYVKETPTGNIGWAAK